MIPPILRRLIKRHYLPLLGSLLLWGLVILSVGIAGAALLAAALSFVRAVQLLTRMPTLSALRRRRQAPAKVVRKSDRRARRIQAASLGAGVAIVGLLVAALDRAGQVDLAAAMLLIAIGLPVRNLLQTQRQCSVSTFFRSLNWIGAFLLAPAWLLGWNALEIAFLLGVREWLAGALSLLRPVKAQTSARASVEPMTAAEVRAVTVLRARQAFVYLVGKAAMGLVVPGAALFARTGREFRIHHRLERIVPRNRAGFLLFTLAPAVASAAIVLVAPEPALLLVSALLAKVAGAAGSVLLWSPYLQDEDLSADDEEDE
jgi:hypothetical protein